MTETTLEIIPADIVIVGAGPAGLMAADHLATLGHRVALYDRMPSPGRKFLMAGRGGLNLTHSEPLATFVGRYGPAREWIGPMVESFPPEALRDFAKGLGQITFIGSSGRVFPRAMKASPWLRAWLTRLGDLGVTLHTRHTFLGFDDAGAVRFSTADGAEVAVRADAVVLALGGASWPRLGADGGWVEIIERDGVPVTPLEPSNCGFDVAWSDHMRRLAGEPVKRAAVVFGTERVRGEIMITGYGLEGGAIYALSRPLRQAIRANGHADIAVDLRPDFSEAQLAAKLAEPRGKRSLSTHLAKAAGLAPASVALLREGHRPLPTEPEALARAIKSVPVRLVATRPIDRAISTAGGVAREAVDFHLMLRKRPGVFVAGEMLDWEAPTGGYLLQATFASAVRAATGVGKYLARRK